MRWYVAAIICLCCILFVQDYVNGWSRRRRRRRRTTGTPTRFSTICSLNKIRGCDNCGCGNYGARRSGGSRKHTGVDIVCPYGSSVYAPFPARVVRKVRPYGNGKPHDTGILLQGTGKWSAYKVMLFYVKKSVANGSNVSGGSTVGTMVNMAKQYYRCAMTNHVHVKLYKNDVVINPTSFV